MATANDAFRLFQRRVNDNGADGRFSPAAFMDWLTVACDQVIRDVEFPWCRFSTKSIPNLQAYQLPELVVPKRVYVQGRIYVPTERDALEGIQIQYYDQTSMGPAPICGSAAPVGTTGQYAPQWATQTPASLPDSDSLNQFVWPAPLQVPWLPGTRPEFFMDGGYLILVPPPSTAPPVLNGQVFDNIEVLATAPCDPIVDLNQRLWLPRAMLSMLVWRCVMEAAFSDETQISSDRRNFAMQEYGQEKKERRNDVKRFFNAGGQSGVIMNTGRGYQYGRRIRRNGWGYS